MPHIENYLTIETQTEDNDRRPSLAELQAEDRVSILSFKKIHICLYVIQRRYEDMRRENISKKEKYGEQRLFLVGLKL